MISPIAITPLPAGADIHEARDWGRVAAAQALALASWDGATPVPVDGVARAAGVSLWCSPLGERMSVTRKPPREAPGIYVSSTTSLTQRREAIAKELGIIFARGWHLGGEGDTLVPPIKAEMAASSAFAHALLMPEKSFEHDYSMLRGRADHLATTYQVPYGALQSRISQLGLPLATW